MATLSGKTKLSILFFAASMWSIFIPFSVGGLVRSKANRKSQKFSPLAEMVGILSLSKLTLHWSC